MDIYASTERYTVEKFTTEMGDELNRVISSQGMVSAILPDEEFNRQFELVLEPSAPDE